MILATVFGLGLVGSYLVLGLCLLSFRKSIPDLESFSFVTGVVVILIGLNLLGSLKSPVEMYLKKISGFALILLGLWIMI